MFTKLLQPRIWKRLYIERLGEPLIYNLVSIFVLLFGSFRQKIKYDLVPRQPYAFSLDLAFSEAQKLNITHLSFLNLVLHLGLVFSTYILSHLSYHLFILLILQYMDLIQEKVCPMPSTIEIIQKVYVW